MQLKQQYEGYGQGQGHGQGRGYMTGRRSRDSNLSDTQEYAVQYPDELVENIDNNKKESTEREDLDKNHNGDHNKTITELDYSLQDTWFENRLDKINDDNVSIC